MAIGAVIRMEPAKKRASATASWPSRQPSPDSELVERLRVGDPDAAAEFFDQYATRIRRFIAHALGVAPDSDADDLLQDTLIALAEALPYYRSESSLFTFACAIAHRKTMSHLRRAARRARLTVSASGAFEHDNDPVPDLELRVALKVLDPDYREILFLKYVEDLSVAAIARVVSASEHAVESRLARARRALKKLLAKRP